MQIAYALRGLASPRARAALQESSDEASIGLIAEGDKRAMRVLHARHNVRMRRFIRSNSKYLIAAAAGVALVVLAANWATRLEAAPSSTMVAAHSRSTTHEAIVDRSGKGDRLDFVAPASRGGAPTGCDAPFSPLAKLSPSNVIGRCLT
jgi:hypothetical protein